MTEITTPPSDKLLDQQQLAERQHAFLAAGTGQSIEFPAAPIDTDTVLYEGIDLAKNPVVGELEAGSSRFAIFGDPQAKDGEPQYLISPTIWRGYDDQGKACFYPYRAIPLEIGKTFNLGRNSLKELGADQHVDNSLSREHAKILVDERGKIHVTQVGKTNPTHVYFGEFKDDFNGGLLDNARPMREIRALAAMITTKDTIEVSLEKHRSIGKAEHALKGEDTILDDERTGVAGVFDGAGGHDGGKLASQLAAQEFMKEYNRHADYGDHTLSVEDTKHAFLLAMQAADSAVGNHIDAGITTGAVAVIVDGQYGKELVYASVGDSRIYIYDRGADKLTQVTQDEGEGNMLDNALGAQAKVKQVGSVMLVSDGSDEVIICSDGITGDKGADILTDEEIKVAMRMAQDPQDAANNLLDISRKRDDKSVVVMTSR